jgi:hypothetical protein
MRLLMACTIVTGIFGLATPAFAEVAPSSDPAVVPGFMMMDVDGERSQLELDAGLGFATDSDVSGTVLMPRLRVQGEIAPAFSLYGSLQLATFINDGSSDSEMSNPEVGGVYHARVSPNADVSAHGGLVLGVGDSGAGLASLFFRPSDLVMGAGDSWWARGGVSGTYHDGVGFMRVDAGVDLQLRGDGGPDAIFHVNAGAGVGNAEWSAAAELQSLFTSSGEPDSLHAMGISVHHHGASVSPYLGLSTPVGNGLTFEVLSVSGGASFAL